MVRRAADAACRNFGGAVTGIVAAAASDSVVSEIEGEVRAARTMIRRSDQAHHAQSQALRIRIGLGHARSASLGVEFVLVWFEQTHQVSSRIDLLSRSYHRGQAGQQDRRRVACYLSFPLPVLAKNTGSFLRAGSPAQCGPRSRKSAIRSGATPNLRRDQAAGEHAAAGHAAVT
jgi:hypothetical protein